MGNYVHFTRRKLLLYLLPASAACVSIPLSVESLQPRISNGQFRIAAPQFHFVAGKALERLQRLARSLRRPARPVHRPVDHHRGTRYRTVRRQLRPLGREVLDFEAGVAAQVRIPPLYADG